MLRVENYRQYPKAPHVVQTGYGTVCSPLASYYLCPTREVVRPTTHLSMACLSKSSSDIVRCILREPATHRADARLLRPRGVITRTTLLGVASSSAASASASEGGRSVSRGTSARLGVLPASLRELSFTSRKAGLGLPSSCTGSSYGQRLGVRG